jgi:hypothetical protein
MQLDRWEVDMSRVRFITLLLMTILFVFLLSATVFAGDWNRAATAIFNRPVQIPGKVLPPGIYVFKIADISGERNVVQIWNADETVLVATVMGWPEYSRRAPERNVFVFEEREKGSPPALTSWFHEGNSSGERFVYRTK